MTTSFHSILTNEMQRLCVTAADRIRLTELISEIESTLSRYKKENIAQNISPKQLVWERKMLDLSFRNNLLNIKVGKRVAKFMPCAIDALEDLLADGAEYELNTEFIEVKDIRNLYRTARTMMEESGANSLFLTLGTLRYDGHLAPLLLMPVDIISAGKGRYVLRKRDEGTMFNFTLIEFLKQNYGVELNPYSANEDFLPTDAHGIDVNLVLHQIKHDVLEQEDWEVIEDSHLGIFSFTKYIMWHDIHTHGQILSTHPLLQSLIEARLLVKDIDTPADVQMMDSNIAPINTALPMPCDSSQMEAVVDAEAGRNFILYGPPGTGKSQTITNLIANALYHGKRVLFVAQKKAALEVVEKRLTDIGLASFCMELHGNKVSKQHFLSQMETLVQIWQNAKDVDIESFRKASDELFNKRREIAMYIDAISYKASDTDISVQDCITQYSEITSETEIFQNTIENKLTFSPQKEAKLISKEELEEIIKQCHLLDAGEAILGMPIEDFPLAGLHPKADHRDLEKNLSQALSQLSLSIDKAEKQADSDLNRKFMNRSAKEILESDYKWKNFVQLANPDVSLLDNFQKLKVAVQIWQNGITMLDKWMRFLAPEEFLRKNGYEDAVTYHNQGHSGAATAEAIRKGWLRKQAEKKIKENPVLAEFSSLLFEHAIDKYRTLAKDFEELTRKIIVQKLTDRIVESSHNEDFNSQMTLLRKRIANKGRGTTIRSIMEQTQNLHSTMMPCMLMSPLSVAQYLDMEAHKFDIVVFDEASQMPTGEAVGSIARGKSVVVVGDPKQMPPTSFFTTTSTDDEEIEIEDLDSILDDCISLSMPTRYLSWHYRSSHESLIAFSNRNYYDGRLFTFPSTECNVSHVTWQHVNGFYDFGKSRTNRSEAEAIVAEVEARLQSGKQDSIGIIAFSKQQSDLIEDILNEHIYADADLNENASHLYEPIFVKNLENVQGDERDVILFSVGYGPDKDGKVSMNFGPLNKVGGERRLNVAVSRARKEMKVFSTLRPEQIDERRTQAEGVMGLKRFLEFATKDGHNCGDTSIATKKTLVLEVAKRVESKGYKVATNVGMSDVKIDLAIVNPTNERSFLLGIVFDGENYQKMKAMRDREIVQPNVLQHLGWNIMHVWSIEWFVNPDMVIKNIETKLHKL